MLLMLSPPNCDFTHKTRAAATRVSPAFLWLFLSVLHTESLHNKVSTQTPNIQTNIQRGLKAGTEIVCSLGEHRYELSN